MTNPVAAAAATPAVATATVAAPAANTAPAKTWRDSQRDYVNWTAKYAFSTGDSLKVGDNDGVLSVIMKLALTLIASVALFPIACLGNAYSWVKSSLCESVRTANTAQAPPAAQTPATPANDAATAAPAAVVVAPAADAAVVAPAANAGAAPVQP